MSNDILIINRPTVDDILEKSSHSNLTLVLRRHNRFDDNLATILLNEIINCYTNSILYFSLELEKAELYKRDNFSHYSNVIINDEISISVESIYKCCKKYVKTKDIKTVVIDNISLVSIKELMPSRKIEMEEILLNLKRLSLELDLRVIVLGYLSTYQDVIPNVNEISVYYGDSHSMIIDNCFYFETLALDDLRKLDNFI